MTVADLVRDARSRRWVVLLGVVLVAAACSAAGIDLDIRADASEPEPTVPTVAPATDDPLALLDSLAVEPEHEGGYDRSSFRHWDDADGDGCDTRCEVLAAQRRPDGSWFSEWDGATEVDPGLIQIDHVVALAEAWRSGAHAWSDERRDAFADDETNLLAVSEASNLRKRDHDAARWFPSRAEANCLWARTVVEVKAKWQLSVDPDEASALRNLLATCDPVL